MILVSSSIICFLVQFIQCQEVGFIVTGGYGARTSAEFHDSSLTSSCDLPDLPDMRRAHTQNGGVLCGGGGDVDTLTSCLTLTDHAWSVSHQLLFRRYEHSSWWSEEGVLLIGGYESSLTTELLTNDGKSERRFDLDHGSDSSCLIDERGSFMLTGGYDGGKVVGTVSRYDINGFIEDLQPLNNPRYDHGCTQYLDSNIGSKINIVCGGFDSRDTLLSSCEVNQLGSDSWSYLEASLPLPLGYLTGLTIDNRVLMIGGEDQVFEVQNSIYELDLTNNDWILVGNLKTARSYHAVSVVDREDLHQLCA